MIDLKGWTERTGWALIVIFLLWLGLFQGAQLHTFTVDLFFFAFEFLWLDAALSSVGLALFFLVSAIIYLSKVLYWTPKTPENNGKVTCVIPTYRDSDVLHRSVESLLDSEYKNLEVLVVCEEDDKKGIKEAERLSENGRVDYLVNDRYSGTKAGAMNLAAEETDSEYLAFFDSDQKIRSDFISSCVAELGEKDVVTGRNVPKPDGLVESLGYYESVFFTYVSRQLLSFLTDFRLVGSRSVVMKREVFEELNGYSEEMLTEDYEFTHRCYIKGFDVANIPCPVENMAAHSFRDWWGQRKRWMTGYFQVFHRQLRKLIWDSKNYRNFMSVLISGLSLIGSFLMLTIVSKFVILLLVGAQMVYLIPISLILLIALVFRLYDRKYGSVEETGLSWLLVPLIFPLFSLITVRSFMEFLMDREIEWYHVEK